VTPHALAAWDFRPLPAARSERILYRPPATDTAGKAIKVGHRPVAIAIGP
jgi:hypothetical protein